MNENGTGSYDNYLKTADGTVLAVPDEIKDTSDPNYAQNVMDWNLNTVTVSNYAMINIDDATTNITVKKNWLPYDKAGDHVVINLYRVSDGALNAAVKEETIILDGSETDAWTHTWVGLPLYEKNGDNTVSYDYYVAEVPLDGYSLSYNFETETITVNGETVTAVHATTATITVTNTTGYELPDSGSTGTLPIILIGMVLAAGSILSGCRRKRKRERRLN